MVDTGEGRVECSLFEQNAGGTFASTELQILTKIADIGKNPNPDPSHLTTSSEGEFFQDFNSSSSAITEQINGVAKLGATPSRIPQKIDP